MFGTVHLFQTLNSTKTLTMGFLLGFNIDVTLKPRSEISFLQRQKLLVRGYTKIDFLTITSFLDIEN